MRAAATPWRRPQALYALLTLLFLVSVTYRALDIAERVGELRYGHEYVRAPFGVDLPEYVLTRVEEEAARAGLAVGDRVVAINGRPIHHSAADLWAPLRAARVGERFAVEAQRPASEGSRPVNASVVLQPLRSRPPSALDVTSFLIVNVTMPIVCTALGFWVATARTRDPRAWLLLFLMLSVAEFTGGNFRFLYGRQDLFQPIAAAYQPVLANFWPTAMLLFAIYFPDRLSFDRRFPWIKWILIAPIAVRVIGTNPVFEFLARLDPHAALDLHAALAPTRGYVVATYLFFIVAFLAIMGFRTLFEREPDARRRLLLLDSGTAVSVLPALGLSAFVAGKRDVTDWIVFPTLGFLLLLPLTMVYVIVVHRAMDVSLVVRQGLQYLLARGTLRFVQVALSIIAVAVAAMMGAGAGGVPVQTVLITASFSIVLLIQRFGRTFATRVDRRFFREAYSAEQILGELAAEVRTMVRARPLLETVTRRIADTLHVTRIAILLNENGVLRPVYAIGYADALPVEISEHGTVGQHVLVAADACMRLDAPDAWAALSEEESECFSVLQSELLLPLTLNGKLLGVASLGAKRSEEPYSSSDLRLLGAVAAQTGLALANSQLTAQVATEVAEREKRRRELEIAREVQQRLLPQENPPIADFEYDGYCRPALAIGGDYYDFIQCSPSQLGIAIGDISGKGIPAALLMATLRAFLRGQTIRGEADLARLFVDLNTFVYESSAANRYATFFYAQYDPSARLLRYVNAGSCPPIVFRGNGDAGATEILRLDVGGPVIGLLPTSQYQEGSIALRKGDLLVAFTDGISEAMNLEDEEWGEERLIQVVCAADGLAPAALIEHIVRAIDSFVGSAPQHDDMTLLIARCS